jgi:hypothetical protein
MPEYHFYCIDNERRVVSRHSFEGADDAAALEKAREFCGKFEVEAWQSTRLIGRIQPELERNS